MKLKGQSSLEFLAYVSISALILAGMYGVMASKQEQTFEYNQRENAQKIAEKTGFQVEMALVQGEGYSRVFTLPAQIGGDYYNITLVNETTLIEWRDKTTLRSTLYSDKEINLSTNETNVFKVMNKDGEVTVEAEQ